MVNCYMLLTIICPTKHRGQTEGLRSILRVKNAFELPNSERKKAIKP